MWSEYLRMIDAQLGAREQVVLAFAQMQRDLGAARRPSPSSRRRIAAAVGLPAHALRRRLAGAARLDRDLVGDDERRIEADAELADQVRVLLLVAGQLREELARARLGDRAEVRDHFVAVHADAVVADGERPRRGVVVDADRELGIVLEQRLIVERLEAQLVAGVGRVRDQLAQEDLAVRIQRVDHQVQELLDLGLEAQRLAAGGCRCGVGHGSSSHPATSIEWVRRF